MAEEADEDEAGWPQTTKTLLGSDNVLGWSFLVLWGVMKFA